MATWLTYLIVGWLGFGIGMSFTAYVLMGSRMLDDMQLERNIKSPQKMLAEWL